MFRNPMLCSGTHTCVQEPNILFGNPMLCSQKHKLAYRNPMFCLGTQCYFQEPYVNVQEPELVFRNPTFCLGTQCYFQEPYVMFRNPNFPVLTEEARGRFSGLVDWSPYDPTYKKYLQIGKHIVCFETKDGFSEPQLFIDNKLCIVVIYRKQVGS